MGLHQLETAEESRPVSHNICNTRRSVQIQKSEVWCNFRTRNAQNTIQDILPWPEELNWWHRRVCGNSWGTRPSVGESSENVWTERFHSVWIQINAFFMRVLLSGRKIGANSGQNWSREKAERPTCASEVRSFLGLFNFSARFNRWGSWHAERSVQTDRWTGTGI